MEKKTLAQQAAKRDGINPGMGQRSGDHVFMDQDRAVEEGFRNISKPWWEKTLPGDRVVEMLESDSEECLDLEVDADHMVLEEDGTIELDGEKLKFSDHAAGGLCEWARLPMGIRDAFLSHGDEEGIRLFSESVNRGFRIHHSHREKGLKLRLRGTTVRAVVSDEYASIENSWAMETLNKMVPGGRVSHWRYDGDTMSGMLLIPDTIREEEDSDYGGGIHFRNSEVGTATLFVRPAVFRSICMNGCIWGQLKGQSYVSKRHRGTIDFTQMSREIYGIIQEQIPLTAKCIDELLATRSITLQNRIDAVRVMAGHKGLTKGQRRAWVHGFVEEGEGYEVTAFGVIQGLTRAARDTMNPTEAVAMEMLSGELVNKDADWWARETKYLSTMTDEDLVGVLSEPLFHEVMGAFK